MRSRPLPKCFHHVSNHSGVAKMFPLASASRESSSRTSTSEPLISYVRCLTPSSNRLCRRSLRRGVTWGAPTHVAPPPAHTPRAATRSVARLAGALRGTRPHASRTVVLCYHSIGESDSPLSLPPAVFRGQVELLAEAGFEFVTFGRLVDALATGSLPTRPTAVLTFDDGFADMH